MKRRDFLRAASGGAAVSATAGVAGAADPADSGAPAQQTGTATGNGTATTTGGTTAPDGTTAAPNGTTSPNGTATTSPGGGGGGGTTHDVDMEGVAFTPDSLTIAPGDTVRWTTTGSSAHSVTAYEDEIPEDAAYFASGGFESEDAARSGWTNGEGAVDEGESYSHTFETLGTYGYFCIPHETAGMTGTIEVVEGGGGDGGEGGGALDPHEMGVPFQAHFVGIATVLMMLVSTIFTFFVVKYGGSPHASSPNRRD